MSVETETLSPQGRLRVLCLHSFRTSGLIFQQQLQRAGLLEALSDLVEFTFIDAPHPASGPIPRDVRPYFEGPYYEWFTAEAVGDLVEFDEAKMEASERFLMSQLAERGPFDGLMGFSQGAVISSAMVALQRSGLRPQLAAQAPVRFCILFGGLKSRHPGHVAAFEALSGKVPCPSLHVYGDKDALKNPHCVELADSFQGATVLLHQRGHVIPALQPQQLAAARAFIQSAAAAAAPLQAFPDPRLLSRQPTSMTYSAVQLPSRNTEGRMRKLGERARAGLGEQLEVAAAERRPSGAAEWGGEALNAGAMRPGDVLGAGRRDGGWSVVAGASSLGRLGSKL